MPPRQAPANRRPHTVYTKLLSALRKTELVRLCLEFRLNADGSVLNLRNRLKDYLNLHRDTLYRDPRYTGLFPRHRRLNQPPPILTNSSRTISSNPPSPSTPPASPGLSYAPSSPALSFASWNGIEEQPHVPPIHVHPPVDHPPAQPHYLQEMHDHHHPHLSSAATDSQRGSPLPPVAHVAHGRKCPRPRSY
jgi:hypothetical protein